jgi:hypothetical protein
LGPWMLLRSSSSKFSPRRFLLIEVACLRDFMLSF